MRTVVVALLFASTAALALGGCSATSVPDGPTKAEVDAYWDHVLDATWEQTSDSLIMDQPVIAQGEVLDSNSWFTALIDCMGAAGVPFEGMSSEDGGGFDANLPATLTLAERQAADLSFYTCVARHPPELVDSGVLRTPAQLEYIYDYFERWLIPCLNMHGYHLDGYIPTRAEFLKRDTHWTPYVMISVVDESDVAKIQSDCGPEFPKLK